MCKPETKTKEIALKLTIAQRKKTFSIYVTPTVRASRGEYPSRMLLGNGKQEENAELRNFCPKNTRKNQSQKRKCDLKERKSRLGEEDSDYDRNGHNCPRLLNLRTVDLCKNYKLYISLRKKVRSGGRKRSTEEKKKFWKVWQMTRRGHMSNGFLNLAEDKNTVYRLKPKDERNYDLWRAKKRPSAAETLERTPPWHFFRDRKQERESIAWNPSRSRHGADDKLHPIVLIILSNFDHNWRRECTRHSESQARGGMT